MAKQALPEPKKFIVNISAKLGRLGANYAKEWELWAKEVDAWPDTAVKKDPGACLELIYGTVGTGRIAFMAGGSSSEIYKLQRRLDKKCQRWEVLAHQAGYRAPGLF